MPSFWKAFKSSFINLSLLKDAIYIVHASGLFSPPAPKKVRRVAGAMLV
jgi:hypothetical protein